MRESTKGTVRSSDRSCPGPLYYRVIIFGDRLTVGQRPLKPLIGGQNPVPEQCNKNKTKNPMPYRDSAVRKAYYKEYGKAWHQKNKEQRNKQISERKRELQKFIVSLKQKCSRCEETNPACLEFHHKVPGEKEICLSAAARSGWSKDRILKEIAKCDLFCANCHRKEHNK